MKSAIKKLKQYYVLIALVIVSNFLVRGPDLYDWSQTPQGYQFSQSSWFDPWDTNVYLSAIIQGQQGHWMYQNVFETTNESRAPVYLIYLTLGNSFPNSNPIILFHVLGSVGTIILAISMWQSIRLILPTEARSTQLLAFSLSYLGGGIGWLVSKWIYLPDVAVPHVTALSALRQPHDAISLAAIIATITILLKVKNIPSIIYVLIVVSTIIHPFSVLIIASVITTNMVLNSEFRTVVYHQKKLYLNICVIIGILYIGLLQQINQHPTISGLSEGQFYSPHIILLLAVFIVQISYISISTFENKYMYPKYRSLYLWVLAILLLIYIPVNYQRLLIRSLFFPIALLSAIAITHVWAKYKMLWLILLMTAIVHGDSLWFSLSQHQSRTPWKYLPIAVVNALSFASNNASPTSNIFSLYYIGNNAAQFSNNRSYLGHNHLTPDFKSRAQIATAFYKGQLKTEQVHELLTANHIDWVIWGPEEQSLSDRFPYFDQVGTPIVFNNVLVFPTEKSKGIQPINQ